MEEEVRSKWRCFFGHKKKFVSIYTLQYGKDNCPHGYSLTCCHDQHEERGPQGARWICERCGTMGIHVIPAQKGIYKIEFGKLVPDEKVWSNPPAHRGLG